MITRNYEGLTPKQILKYFFIDIKAWVEDGKQNGFTTDQARVCIDFMIDYGLCNNLENWLGKEHISQLEEVVFALPELFEDYPCKLFPFNNHSINPYCYEKNKYTNQERLKFINRMVEEL